jgi:O-antigen biosynthesis protein
MSEFKKDCKNNRIWNFFSRSILNIMKRCGYCLPKKYRHKLWPSLLKKYPSHSISSNTLPNLCSPIYISHKAETGYTFSTTPNDYIYIPVKKPVNFNYLIDKLISKPKFSVVVPIYNTPVELFELMVLSVKRQWYENWELILVNDASPNPEITSLLEKVLHDDNRIKVINLSENLGIAGATNVAIDNACGDYIVFLDHDDELTENCLFELAKCINQDDPDFVYSDEDKITPEGSFTQPHFKPDWSPDTMMSTMYTCHVACVKTRIVKRLGGLRSKFNGCQDWDFVLRLSEMTNKISHIPKVLYHWRIIPASTAADISAKPYVIVSSKAVREDALKRRRLKGIVEELPNYKGYFRVNYLPINNPLISIIIPTRDNCEILKRCINSILNFTHYQNFEIIIVDNGSVDINTIVYLKELNKHEKISVLKYDIPFNYSKINNFAVSKASGELLLFLNDDTEVLQKDWLERMAGYAQLEHVGAVGAKLIYPDGHSIQHAGVLNLHSGPVHAFSKLNKDIAGYFLRNQIEYNWLIVTGACLMIDRKKFLEISGFDESFPVAYNDVDISMRLYKSGYFNIVCQSVNLIHYESISRGIDCVDQEKALRLEKDLNRLNMKHPYFYQFDPFFNRNFLPNGYNFDISK